MSDKRVLTISVIVLVAVVMGMSAVAPAIPQAEATPGGALSDEVCNQLDQIDLFIPAVQHLLDFHCVQQ